MEDALTNYQEDREVNLRKATDSNIAQATLLWHLGAGGEVRRDRRWMSLLLRYLVKIAALSTMQIAPRLYVLTLRAREHGTVAMGWRLSSQKIAFISGWKEWRTAWKDGC